LIEIAVDVALLRTTNPLYCGCNCSCRPQLKTITY